MAVNKLEMPKRVACFYRVSTKGQLDGDDIPMQKRACRDFVDKMGWVVVKDIVDNIVVYKDSIELNVKLNITNFIASINDIEKSVLERAYRWQR